MKWITVLLFLTAAQLCPAQAPETAPTPRPMLIPGRVVLKQSQAAISPSPSPSPSPASPAIKLSLSAKLVVKLKGEIIDHSGRDYIVAIKNAPGLNFSFSSSRKKSAGVTYAILRPAKPKVFEANIDIDVIKIGEALINRAGTSMTVPVYLPALRD